MEWGLFPREQSSFSTGLHSLQQALGVPGLPLTNVVSCPCPPRSHAIVLEGVAKSQFPRKAVVFKSGDRKLLRFCSFSLGLHSLRQALGVPGLPLTNVVCRPPPPLSLAFSLHISLSFSFSLSFSVYVFLSLSLFLFLSLSLSLSPLSHSLSLAHTHTHTLSRSVFLSSLSGSLSPTIYIYLSLSHTGPFEGHSMCHLMET